ncbi:hypothetical protein ROZALSC1DRAFT_20330 [Rozella allomycis CSF55]|uniref:Uncharacterized protein n=1 Tax=Rozella allomycis (strain CSF55) TaxID=988480 RepID=A0A4P9YPL0_ROZAC|nr:hypothetical protein ROZALSC1DRAFT_20330 [Rozella allomycis CSF55]
MATVSASLNFSQEDSSETLSQFDSSNLSTELEVQLYQTVCSLRDTLKQSTDMSNGLLCKLKECYIRKCDLEEENDQLNKALHFINDKHELEIHERKVLAKNYDQCWNRKTKTLQQDLDETTRLLYEQHDYSSPNLFSETDFMDINGTGLRPCVSLETELSSSMPNPNEGLRRSRSSDSDLILNENIIHEEKTRAREMLLTSIKIKTFDSGINTPVNEFTEIEELIYFFVEQIGESDLVQINRKLKQPFDITKVSGISQGIVDDVRTKAELLKVNFVKQEEH